MPNARITELRSIELGVPDLDRSSDFYQAVWGLREVVSDGDTVHLRGTCAEHHVVTLRQRPRAALLGVHFSASDRNAITELHAKAKAYGTDGLTAPAELARTAGGGYGFRFNTPDGLPLAISADVIQHPEVVTDRSRPTKLTHVVLNSARIDEQTAFFKDLLGFRHSDSTEMMEFIRCCADHHSVAFARGNGPSLNHMAYEMPNIDGLMRGTGRMKQNGFNIEWGVGRHGPGRQCLHLFHRAERLRHRIHHRGGAGRRGDLRAQHGRVLGQISRPSMPLEYGRASVEPPARRHGRRDFRPAGR
jgi:catechol 2,3-dioxygenase-like lactoylglutathione lyase family enzyme